MKKNSQTHPLRIDSVQPLGIKGKIGMTLCPGKVQAVALSGQWERDLESDLAAIQAWGASVLISLMEPQEFKTFQVERMAELMPAGIEHHVLPIVDAGIPNAYWEQKWQEVGPKVRQYLREGHDIVIHCLGGLGRTGLLAARLLVEFGESPREAIARVRKARRGAIETRLQEEYILRQLAVHDPVGASGIRPRYGVDPGLLDRYVGCLVGGAVGDALGAPVEFMDLGAIRRQFGPGGIRDYVPAYGRLGAITDDTQMTLFTAEGLLRACVRVRQRGIGPAFEAVTCHAYLRWLKTQGHRSVIRIPDEGGWLIGHKELFNRRAPGMTCLSALETKEQHEEPARNDSKGCGGVMRMAPVGLFVASWQMEAGEQMRQAFELGCRLAAITHGHPSGQLPAGVLAVLVLRLVQGAGLMAALSDAKSILARYPRNEETLEAMLQAEALARSERGADECIASLGEGWVAEEALAIAIFCALRAESFEKGVAMAVNITGDSDSTGAITGNLLGAALGKDAIPGCWLDSLELRELIVEMAEDLASWPAWRIADYPFEDPQQAAEQEYWQGRYPPN